MGKRRQKSRKQRTTEIKKPYVGDPDDRKPYKDIVRDNDAFTCYYEQQNICKNDDWNEFLTAIKTDLPSSFRITASKSEANALLNIVENQYINECRKQSENPDSFFPLPWYPNRMAWQLGLTRKDIRRNESYYKFHNFLISETQNGTINRQETVSMIPPLVLDVQSHHKVLDMCAAPGSKTAQLIELLHGADESNPIPSGFVVANDIDNNRCYMLVHQAKRLNSPCIAITNHNSQLLPNMFVTNSKGHVEKLQFDRILCDVPCSGDGTLRKNPDIWMKWTAANGLNQHGVQFRIARRGIELLAVGGRLVYSTCSLNPVENEAVVSRLLEHAAGALKLVDVSDKLKGLKFAPGMSEWMVASRQMEFYEKFEEVDDKWKTTIRPQMFPPSPENKEKFQLHKCVRIYPHYQDTGAFFVAVFEKVDVIINRAEEREQRDKEKDDSNEVMDEEVEEECDEPKPSKIIKLSSRNKKHGYKEDPFLFFKDDEPVWKDIKDYYKISDDFSPKCLLTRCHVGKKKNIYFCSEAVRDLVSLNQKTMKFINTGLKTFVRSDNRHMKCAFRLAHEGLESTIHHINGRKINIAKKDLLELLMNMEKSPEITSLSQMIQDQVAVLSPGSCILCYSGTDSSEKDELLLNISGWRGTSSLRCYVTDFNAAHYLRILGGDFSKYDVNKFQKNIPTKDEEEEKDKKEKQVEKEMTTKTTTERLHVYSYMIKQTIEF